MSLIQLETYATKTQLEKEYFLTNYPRPQLVRLLKDNSLNFINLNTKWDFTIDKSMDLPLGYLSTINVPYQVESILSGIGKDFDNDTVYHYKTVYKTSLEDLKRNNNRLILHFDGVDGLMCLYVNKKLVEISEQTYLRRSFDITKYLNPVNAFNDYNEIEVCIKDDLSKNYPYGKQKVKRGGMWYTKTSGIWKDVWMEVVPLEHIESFYIKTNKNKVTITFDNSVILDDYFGYVLFNNEKYDIINNQVEFIVNDPIYWTPEKPYLYNFEIKYKDDFVYSYFALRDISIKEINGIKRICLNDKEYFFNGLLDQGYTSDSILSESSDSSYYDDITKMKALGFNTLRKHIKIESDKFYYLCDKLGMIVMQDMVNNGRYSFIHDSVLPFLSRRNFLPIINQNKKSKMIFEKEMIKTVKALYNHPSICLWTIFNEGWGEFNPNKMYDELKLVDDTRLIDSSSGWFKNKKTDVESYHIYFRKFRFKINKNKLKRKPIILSEFGGYSLRIENHVSSTKNYGYKSFENRDEFLSSLKELYYRDVIANIDKGLCASIYTQVSDVEDETNGILTYDRKVSKVNEHELDDVFKRINEINKKA